MSDQEKQTTITPLGEPGPTEPAEAPGGHGIAAEPEATAAKPTTYLILVKDAGVWKIGSTEIQAGSAERAVRQYAESVADAIPAGGATLVAVSTRNWREVSVKAQTVTTLVIEGA